MPYPALYDFTYSYTGFQQSQGNNSFPGTQMDADMAGLESAIESVSKFAKNVVRSDGALNNGIVTYDSLSPSLRTAGLAPATAWATATLFKFEANVIQNGSLYRSTEEHTSGVFADDLTAGKWTFVVALPAGPQGVGGTIAINSTTTLAPGLPATVVNVGTPQNASLDVGIPSGLQGIQGPTGAGYGGTSATSFAITNSVTRVFTTQAGLAYQVGNYMRVSSAANGANFMEGLVSAYSGTSLSIDVTKIGGSGTFADWRFQVAGAPGTGDLLSTNNLSDVASKKSALDNLSVHGSDVASAATINLESATGDLIDVTGTVAITAVTLSDGHERTVRFTGALTLTNGASLVVPGGTRTTVAGDVAIFRGYTAGVVRCVSYSPIGGTANLAGNQSLAGGFTAASGADGIKSSGTYTPDPLTGNFKHITANGAFTLAPPSAECTMIVEVLNGASAGAITTSGFTKVNGDAYATTNGSKFAFHILKTKNYSRLSIEALQ